MNISNTTIHTEQGVQGFLPRKSALAAVPILAAMSLILTSSCSYASDSNPSCTRVQMMDGTDSGWLKNSSGLYFKVRLIGYGHDERGNQEKKYGVCIRNPSQTTTIHTEVNLVWATCTPQEKNWQELVCGPGKISSEAVFLIHSSALECYFRPTGTSRTVRTGWDELLARKSPEERARLEHFAETNSRWKALSPEARAEWKAVAETIRAYNRSH